MRKIAYSLEYSFEKHVLGTRKYITWKYRNIKQNVF